MTKIFDGETWYPPPRLWFINFDKTPSFLKHWRGAHEHFLHCDTKFFRPKNVLPPIMHKFFRCPNFFETMKGCSRNYSALWDQNFSTEKRDNPFSSIKVFGTRVFQKHSIPSRKSSVLWDNKFSLELCDILLLCIEFFDTRNFLYHRRVPRQNFLALWDENFSSKNRDTLLHKVLNSVVELMFVRTLWKLIWKQ